jgi:ketosteroid isomerase-like protein
MSEKGTPSAVIERLVRAINSHDLEAMMSCFDDGYVNETPVHPKRGFQGSDQVRRNWTQIFAAVPELRAQVLRTAVEGDVIWTEWDMTGTRDDGALFRMAGVVILEVSDHTITSARFYLEPVEQSSGDVNEAISRVVGGPTIEAETGPSDLSGSPPRSTSGPGSDGAG